MNKKILTMQDVSCFGQCSITVALPILSALGFETAILPSAILSTHTSGFKNFTFLDLTKEIPLILNHWHEEKIKFKAFYSGYLGKIKHFDYVKNILKSNLMDDNFKTIIDPVMADDGKLYTGFNSDYVENMKNIAFNADVILPNLSEACFLTNTPYRDNYDQNYIDNIILKLKNKGVKNAVLTGISFEPKTTGVLILHENEQIYHKHKRLQANLHGTGDVFSSTFVGAFLMGNSVLNAAKIAAEFVVKCIEKTLPNLNKHWWGVNFEEQIPWLINKIFR